MCFLRLHQFRVAGCDGSLTGKCFEAYGSTPQKRQNLKIANPKNGNTILYVNSNWWNEEIALLFAALVMVSLS